MLVQLTALYAAILAVILTALAINVTVHRAKLKISLGDGGNPQMLRMIRLHGNAVEYIPLALMLMLVYEINGGSHTVLHIAGVALIAGRLLLTPDMWRSEIAGIGRRAGQSLTWLSIAALAVLNFVKII